MAMMEPRQIILANESRFMREILRRVITKAPGLRIAEEVADLTELPSAVERTNASWIVVSYPSDGGMPEEIGTLLTQYPDIDILVVAGDGSQFKMQWVEVHETSLDAFSIDELIQILKDGHQDNKTPGGRKGPTPDSDLVIRKSARKEDGKEI